MHEIKMGRALSIVERTRKICYSGRQGSLISQNPPALAVGSVKNACLSDFRIVNPTLRTFSAAEARIAQYAILFDLTRVAPPRTRTPNLSAEDMLRTYELAASGSLMPVGDNTWSKKSAFASVPPSKVIEAQFVNVN